MYIYIYIKKKFQQFVKRLDLRLHQYDDRRKLYRLKMLKFFLEAYINILEAVVSSLMFFCFEPTITQFHYS